MSQKVVRRKTHVLLGAWTLINLAATIVLIIATVVATQTLTKPLASFDNGGCGSAVERYSIQDGDIIRYAKEAERAQQSIEQRERARAMGIAAGCSIGLRGELYYK